MKKLVLFSQSPGDIRYVINLYEEFKELNEIKIVVVTVINNYKFLKSLDLKADIEFVPLVSKKNILKLSIFFIRLRFIYNYLFFKCEDANVYFFSNTMDYVTAYFVKKLSIRNTVHFIDIYKVEGLSLKGVKYTFLTFIVELILGINIRFLRYHSGDICYQYNFKKDNVFSKEPKLNSEIKDCYQSRVLSNTKKSKLILLEGNGVTNQHYVNYEKNLRDCIEALSIKYEIYIKPHPRIGFSNFLIDCDVQILESSIPAEFIFWADFQIVLGIDTAAITKAEHENKYCVIDCFDFKNQKKKIKLKEYLNAQRDGCLQYVNDLESISDI